MAPLERLFALEVEFHRLLRQVGASAADGRAVHTSFALQSGYERLLGALGRVRISEIEHLAVRYSHVRTGDVRDVRDARDSLVTLLGLRPHEE
jgi:hypothetical protein